MIPEAPSARSVTGPLAAFGEEEPLSAARALGEDDFVRRFAGHRPRLSYTILGADGSPVASVSGEAATERYALIAFSHRLRPEQHSEVTRRD